MYLPDVEGEKHGFINLEVVGDERRGTDSSVRCRSGPPTPFG